MDETAIRHTARLVRSLEAARDLATFRARLITGIGQVLPADLVSYNEVDHRGGVRLPRMEIEPRDGIPPACWPDFERLAHQHPLIDHYARTGDRQSRRISDFLGRRAFHRLELYQDFFRPLRLEHQMAVTLPAEPGRVIGLALNRGRTDFSDDERILLDLLRPRIVHAFLAATAFERAREAIARSPNEPDLPHGVVDLDAAGRVRAATPAAEGLTWIYFGQPLCAGRALPGELGEWARRRAARHGVPTPSGPLVVERPNGTLNAWWLPGGEAGDRDRVVLCSALDTPRDAADGSLLGRLTARQAQVLAALAHGMRNAEIARQLGLSTRTVEKHLERIYRTLGVQSRTAALAAFAARPAATGREPAWRSGRDG